MAESILKLGFYPYTYVRTVVMRSLLFKRQNYQKMLKMSLSEIAKYLQESHYKSDIDYFGTSVPASSLLELALNRNFSASIEKLIRISPKELGVIIMEYARRRDIENIKTIIRGKLTNSDDKQILNSISASGTLSWNELSALVKKDSIENVLRSSRLPEGVSLKNALKNFEETKNLVAIENALDKSYYKRLLKFSMRIPREGNLFRSFIQKEIEIINLLTLLRLKKAKVPKEKIPEFLIKTNQRDNARIDALSNLDNIDEIEKALSQTDYAKLITQGFEEYKKTSSLIKLEINLYQYLLRISIQLLHTHPLSIDVILGYMLAKEIEIRNLRIIVKGKQLGLSEEFIESSLIVD